jgi:hypothetical protein
MITWALFAYRDGKWHFEGFTPHDEVSVEFEEVNAGEEPPVPVAVIPLEEPATVGEEAP